MNEKKYAGFLIRLLAWFIDTIIVTLITFPISILFVSLPFSEYSDFTALLAGFLSLPYFVVFWMKYSATPGKMLLGLKIITTRGNKVNFKRAVLRLFGYIISNFLFGLGYLLIIIDKNKQGLHDKIAGTYVVYNKK